MLTQVVTGSVFSWGLLSPGSRPTELPKCRRKPSPRLWASRLFQNLLLAQGVPGPHLGRIGLQFGLIFHCSGEDRVSPS